MFRGKPTQPPQVKTTAGIAEVSRTHAAPCLRRGMTDLVEMSRMGKSGQLCRQPALVVVLT